MHAQFRTYRLNEAGQQKAQAISEAFDELLSKLERLVPEGHQLNLCGNKLEQACFFAKKGMAMDPSNHVEEQDTPPEGGPSQSPLPHTAQEQ